MATNAKIYELIGQAMKEVGAIGKDSTNAQQGFKYRGIDAVYNALNPVMAKYGLFICPEIIEQRREERTTKNGTALTYSVLTIKYTVFAPDGSNVSCTVIGEGMDSGDKASNKAMSVAMKYAMFQLFFIPTEAVDPDAEVHTDVLPKNATQTNKTPVTAAVSTSAKVPARKPAEAAETPKADVTGYIKNELARMSEMFELPPEQMMQKFIEMREGLVKAGIIPDVKSKDQTIEQARDMMDAIYKNFTPSGKAKK